MIANPFQPPRQPILPEYIATSLGSYLTSQSGVTIIFESAIVPKFSLRESRLTFKNVYLSRGMDSDTLQELAITEHRSGDTEEDDDYDHHYKDLAEPSLSHRTSVTTPPPKHRVRQESGETLAQLKSRDSMRRVQPERPPTPPGVDEISSKTSTGNDRGDDGSKATTSSQYTHFHLSVDSIEVSLSLPRWLDGKGLIQEAVVKGVRGVVGECGQM